MFSYDTLCKNQVGGSRNTISNLSSENILRIAAGYRLVAFHFDQVAFVQTGYRNNLGSETELFLAEMGGEVCLL
jgi:hypothetical protein